jgi:hypothetical protein
MLRILNYCQQTGLLVRSGGLVDKETFLAFGICYLIFKKGYTDSYESD